MAGSVSGQDESNPALWLATRAGKMELSCPLGTTRRVPQEKFPRKPYNKSFIDQAYSVKMARYWPRSFFASLWTSTPSRSINTQKKELGQYSAILTSHLVNNPYISWGQPQYLKWRALTVSVPDYGSCFGFISDAISIFWKLNLRKPLNS